MAPNAMPSTIQGAMQGESQSGLRANAELLHELAKEVTTRLDLIGRNINMMTDEIFGPVGVAIYKSYLSEALSGIDQARALLDGAAQPDKERRKEAGAETEPARRGRRDWSASASATRSAAAS